MQFSKALLSQIGRTVIVTGGASGFGEGTVRWMQQRGANVVIADIVCFSVKLHGSDYCTLMTRSEQGEGRAISKQAI